ncbi:MAG: hypothetical protein WC107_03145 [Patescibacteria group bacterium]
MSEFVPISPKDISDEYLRHIKGELNGIEWMEFKRQLKKEASVLVNLNATDILTSSNPDAAMIGLKAFGESGSNFEIKIQGTREDHDNLIELPNGANVLSSGIKFEYIG